MELLSAEQGREIDRISNEGMGIPIALLMENAGRGISSIICEQAAIQHSRTAMFILGTGNNGADGLVAARHCVEMNITPTVFVCGEKDSPAELFAFHSKILERLSIPVKYISNEDELVLIKNALQEKTIVIDGLTGTGLQGTLRPLMRQVAQAINACHATIISIDVPSGLHSNTGQVSEDTVKAHITVTMGNPKIGMYLHPGKEYCGNVIVKEIGGIPANHLKGAKTYVSDLMHNKRLLPQRTPTSHKGTNGHVFIIGGQVGMIGAPIMAAHAAVASGAGKTTVGVKVGIADAVMQKLDPEVMCAILPDMPLKSYTLSLEEAILPYVQNKDVLAIGPGLGRDAIEKVFITALCSVYEGPIIVDADGLYALGRDVSILSHREIPAIITPHVGEFSRLTGVGANAIEKDRVGIAREFALMHQLVLVLKGAPTVVAYPDGTVMVNDSGNPGMGTGGMGDVLTGVIAAIVGQGLTPEEGATLGVYLHGLSADICATKKKIGFTPSDVANHMGVAITKVDMEDSHGE